MWGSFFAFLTVAALGEKVFVPFGKREEGEKPVKSLVSFYSP